MVFKRNVPINKATAKPAAIAIKLANAASFGVINAILIKLPGDGIPTRPPPNTTNKNNDVAIPPIVATIITGLAKTNGKYTSPIPAIPAINIAIGAVSFAFPFPKSAIAHNVPRDGPQFESNKNINDFPASCACA